VVVELQSRRTTNLERLRAAADRVIVDERQRARSLLSPLGSIASSAPFIGLFGTVYGIMDAFMRIGAAKSASLPVVAPAIGEALITTAIGLAVAIPAVVFYNAIDKRVADFVVSLEASAAEWVALLAAPAGAEHESGQGAFPAPGAGRG
jgi:biopolymer transport protein TolQ